MSDDLFDALGSDSLFEDEEEELEQDTGEQQNKTFLIAVIVMGGLLALALITFAVWALVINPRMQAQQQAVSVVATEAPTVEIVPTEETPEVEETQPAEEATPEPTSTPKPTATFTPTPVIGPTATPNGDETEAGEGEDSEVTPTPAVVRRTATPVPTEAATATPTRATSGTTSTTPTSTPDTGLGEVALVIAALLLMAVFFAARRLRQA
ncbi:MAG: hypothetical protein ACK2UI_13525 [Anaerolineae bacterium]|jgi:outer membrane biosynthesis protein TonB